MWEICEIELERLDKGITGFLKYLNPIDALSVVFKYKGQFVAKATGPYGTKIVAKSKEFGFHSYSFMTKDAEENQNKLVAQLLNEGWEPTEQGAYWHSFKFRRRVE